MATLERKGENWYCQFMFRRQRFNFSIGKVTEREAQHVLSRADYILMRIRQNLITVPSGVNIVDFIQNDGKPPQAQVAKKGDLTFTEFRESYFEAFSTGAIEANTLYTARIHFRHLENTLGPNFAIGTLTVGDLQRHINRRQKTVSPTTIKKEIDSLRAAWNWSIPMGLISSPFPIKGTTYAKTVIDDIHSSALATIRIPAGSLVGPEGGSFVGPEAGCSAPRRWCRA
jgi:hypothetical protein